MLRGLSAVLVVTALAVAGDGPFTFAAALPAGSSYRVDVATQPSSPPQECTVTRGEGVLSADVTDVQVSCTLRTFTVGGTVTGLPGSGLR